LLEGKPFHDLVAITALEDALPLDKKIKRSYQSFDKCLLKKERQYVVKRRWIDTVF